MVPGDFCVSESTSCVLECVSDNTNMNPLFSVFDEINDVKTYDLGIDHSNSTLSVTLGHHHPQSGRMKKKQKKEAKKRLVPRRVTRREDETK